MVTNRTALTCTVFASLALLGAAYLTAGPLSPPAGPVASTYKTLAEVEPRIAINAANTPGDADSLFKIEKQGSYYLAGNVTGVVGKHGIEIAASGVTLDLNGFDLLGVPGSLDGVSATIFGFGNIEVRTGSVRDWGGDGVDLSSSSNFSTVVTNVRSSGNDGRGISGGPSCIIDGCVASGNASTGIAANGGSTISGCTASYNTGDGISAPLSTRIEGCVSLNNTGDGIEVQSDCTVLGNTSAANGTAASFGAGVRVTGTGNIIDGNSLNSNRYGVTVPGTSNLIIRNTCRLNAVANFDIGTNNNYGPIINRTAAFGAPVTGNSAASSLTTTDPAANFAY